jgi:hypothetical protein
MVTCPERLVRPVLLRLARELAPRREAVRPVEPRDRALRLFISPRRELAPPDFMRALFERGALREFPLLLPRFADVLLREADFLTVGIYR